MPPGPRAMVARFLAQRMLRGRMNRPRLPGFGEHGQRPNERGHAQRANGPGILGALLARPQDKRLEQINFARARQSAAEQERVGFEQRQERERLVDAPRQRELTEIQKIFNSPKFMRENRERLPKDVKELHDLRMLFFSALSRGEVRNFADFESWLRNWLAEQHRNPQAGNYAKQAVEKLKDSFGAKDSMQRKELGQRFQNLAWLAVRN